MPSVVALLQGIGLLANGAILTNPTDGTLLIDSGPLNDGNYLLAVTGSGSVQFVYDLQIRNAANDTTLKFFRRRPAAGNEDFILPFKVDIVQDERVRAVLVGTIVGDVQLSLIYGEVG
jgi:hypothetical protein